MLNAKARSKAKLPIVAIVEEPQGIFSETSGSSNRSVKDEGAGRSRGSRRNGHVLRVRRERNQGA
jgi:hypothetical protein